MSETEKQLIEAKATIQALTEHVIHKLPSMGLSRVELYSAVSANSRMIGFIEEAKQQLEHSNLTEEQTQKLLGTLTSLHGEADFIYNTLYKVMKTNHKISDLVSSTCDILYPALCTSNKKESKC